MLRVCTRSVVGKRRRAGKGPVEVKCMEQVGLSDVPWTFECELAVLLLMMQKSLASYH